jgi:molybdopterin-guanine dinucleotide biosynthesis protein A
VYDGVVLAGGRARRMGGVAKPGLEVDGRRLLDVALEALAGAASRVVVGGTDALPARVTRVCEEPPGGGPVAALAAALQVVTQPVCVVLAADLPFVAAHHVDELVAGLAGAAAAVAVDAHGREQPLLAAYDAAALRAALPVPAAGGSMHRLVGALGELRRVALTGRPVPWFDCDTEGELRAARLWAADRDLRPGAEDHGP